MSTRSFVLALALGGTLAAGASSPALAQIPTTDGISIAARAKEHIETLQKWRKQYAQMRRQIDTLERQWKALTGSRDLAAVMRNPLVRRYLPREWQELYREMKRGGYAGLSGRALEIYEENRIEDACASHESEEERLSCETRAVKPAVDQAFALDAYERAEERLEHIDALVERIDTEDVKESMDLANVIAAEQAKIANEEAKLRLYALASEAEDRIAEQRQREIDARTWGSEETTELEPLAFGRGG